MANIKNCSRCGGRTQVTKRQGRFVTVHLDSANGHCPHGPSASTLRRLGGGATLRRDPDQQAEYRMTAEYAAEVRTPYDPRD